MKMQLAVVALSSLLAAGRAAAEEGDIVVEDGDARAEISGSADVSPAPASVAVALTVAGKHAEWKYDDLWLDPEEAEPPVARIVRGPSGRVLLVQTYSGGARCCWGLLAFDVERLEALGPVLEGQSPIAVLAPRAKCPLAAVAEPVDRKNGKPRAKKLYCFSGKRFQARGPAPR
jgi:hypothetical protein